MKSHRYMSLLAIGILAVCGGRADGPRVEEDTAERSPAVERVDSASSVTALEREIKERAHAAGRDSSRLEVSVASGGDGRAAVVSVIEVPSTGRPAAPGSAPADTAPPLSDSALVAGVLRWDGMVAPFAAFERGEWGPIGRAAFEARDERSPVSRWHVYTRRGPVREVRGGTIEQPEDCYIMYESWGQATDLDADTLPWRELLDSETEREWAGRACPMTRIGLALSGDPPLVRMVDADVDGAEGKRVLESVRSVFDEKEAEELRSLQPDTADATRYWTGHPVSAAERSRVPVTLASLRRSASPANGRRLYSFTATRRYAPLERYGRSCETTVLLHGFALGEGRLVFVGPSAGMTGACSDSPGMRPLSTEPYGLLRLDGRWFLLGIEHGYESSAPVVYEVTRTRLRRVLKGWVE